MKEDKFVRGIHDLYQEDKIDFQTMCRIFDLKHHTSTPKTREELEGKVNPRLDKLLDIHSSASTARDE